MNHLEFLKWTGTLEKDDDILLVHILERLASNDPPTPIEPFYNSLVAHQPLPKNALHIAKAYALIQRLKDHDFNVFEFAYLEPKAYRLRALLAFVIQIGIFSCLVVYNIFDQFIMVTPNEDGFFLVVIIWIMSATLLFVQITKQRKDASDFNQVMLRLGSHKGGRRFWLRLNFCINEVLGIFVFVFNSYFILISDTPTEAVLNSVALAFIVEIDDIFKPNLDETRKEDALAEILQHYIMEEVQLKDIFVEAPTNRRIFERDMNVYIQLGDYDDTSKRFTVHVFLADQKDGTRRNITTKYTSVEYRVSGALSRELHTAFSKFHCLEHFQDIVNSGVSRQGQQSENVEIAMGEESKPLLRSVK